MDKSNERVYTLVFLFVFVYIYTNTGNGYGSRNWTNLPKCLKYIYGDGVAENHSHAIKLLIETLKELNDMADELN